MLEHCNSCPFYDQLPESERTPRDYHPSKKAKTKSTQALQWFKNNIPQPNAWRVAQMDRGLETVQSYEAAIRSITAQSKPGFDQAQSNDEPVADQNDVLSVVKALAKAAHASRKEAALYQSIAAFRTLVVLSICVYLEFIDYAWREIDAVISSLGTQREEERRKKLFRAAKIFNKRIIPSMIGSGWPVSRVTELCFLGALSALFQSPMLTGC